MTAVSVGTQRLDSRDALVEIGLRASIAATGFTAAALAFRLSGIELAIALASCAVLIGLMELSRRRAKRKLIWLPASTHPLSALIFCAALGLGAAALGPHGGLLFLPCLFVLGTISILARPPYLLACSALVAGGFLMPAVASGSVGWSAPAAAGALALFPLLLQRGFRGIGLGPNQKVEPQDSPSGFNNGIGQLTKRQFEATTLLAQGLRHQEIADRLGVSIHQVRRLIRQARERTGARTTAELVAMSLFPTSSEQAKSEADTPN